MRTLAITKVATHATSFRPNILPARSLKGMISTSESAPNARKRAGCVTVFGGSGFLGRRIVTHLLNRGLVVRAASRHPSRAEAKQVHGEAFTTIQADILNKDQIAAAVSGASAVVNAVSLYCEHGDITFERIHVEAASQLADAAKGAGAERYIHISGIGSDPCAKSRYIRARGQGEDVVNAAFPGATVVRPAVMIGEDDAFLTRIAGMMRILAAYPLFGRGDTRLQPVFVEDVSEAVARLAGGEGKATVHLYEFGGPRVCTYRELILEIARLLDIRIRLISIPFPAWHALATLGEFLPGSPLTRNQVELMQIDNVVNSKRPGFRNLGIKPLDLEQVVEMIREKL